MRDKRQKTLILSVFFSGFGPFVTGYAVLMNNSATQLADFLRRSVELTVLILALIIYLKIKNHTLSEHRKARYQSLIYVVSAAVLLFSALFLLAIFIQGLISPRLPGGNIYLGLSIAALGILFNGYFWLRYRWFHQQKNNALMETQEKIYQAKTLVDIGVVIALLSLQIFPGQWLSYWIDMGGTFLIASYLTFRSLQFFRQSRRI